MTGTVILRMQGLDAAASTQDIRKFFGSLHIPDGGVYVVGGHLSEAFIAFTTERDAQLAIRFTGTSLKGSKVTLHISSMAELEHKLKSLLKEKSKSSPKQPTGIRPQSSPDKSGPLNAQLHHHKLGDLPLPANPPQPLYPYAATLGTLPAESLSTSTAFLLGICTVLQGLQSGLKQNQMPPSGELKTPELTLNSSPGYIRIFGLPVSATKDDICHFFKGLSVKEAIMNVELGLGHGCLVQFATMQDACDALQYNNRYLGSDSVEVRTATEKMWTSALQECKNADHREKEKPPHSREETVSHMETATCALQLKRQAVNQLPYKVPKKLRTTFSPPVELIVMVRNLPKKMTKTEIKELFRCPLISQKNVLHLLDNKGNRTDTAFLIFNCTEDYDYAMNLSGCHLGPATIEVSAVTKKIMRGMLSKTKPSHIMNRHKDRKENRINLMHQKHEQRWM